jgi:hypothetical protein
MSEKLPIGEFEFCTLTLDDIRNYDENSDYGYFVEVDAHVPHHLHDFLSDFPPTPDKIQITPEMTSEVTREARRKRFGAQADSSCQTKLAPSLFPKNGYKCHIRALRTYMSMGKIIIAT